FLPVSGESSNRPVLPLPRPLRVSSRGNSRSFHADIQERVKRLSIFFIIPAALLFFVSGTESVSAQLSGREEAARNQADAFLAEAALALGSGSPAQARPLVDSALELAPDYSEALYLRARLELADRRTTLPAIAQQTLGEVLLRAGRPSEAQPVLEQLVSTHPEDPRNTLLLARTFAKSR